MNTTELEKLRLALEHFADSKDPAHHLWVCNWPGGREAVYWTLQKALRHAAAMVRDEQLATLELRTLKRELVERLGVGAWLELAKSIGIPP